MIFPFRKIPKPPLAEIAAYRKYIKLYDIFTFFNELDLLEIRLNILYPYVDYFVIIEATQTFSGQPKQCAFSENQKRFEKFKDKILHYVIDDTPSDENELQARLNDPNISALDKEIISNALTSDNVPKGIVHWLKEFYQKESIKKALVKLNENDVCFVSDVDEIWNPEVVIDYRKDDIFKLRQTVYAYYFNNRSSEPWHGTLVTKYKNIKLGCLNHLRTVTKTPYTYIENGGWHFTNQGGAEQIKHKVEATYSADDYNNENVKSKIQERMVKNKDYIGRKFKFKLDERGLPNYILENRVKYSSYFK
jgi:beta-1,4-mannosyl-glycoprotein beta-1,4-N-acetylglucosaminyltransferase